MTVNDKLRNTTIQHAHFIEQYKNHEIKKVLALLNKSDNSLKDQLKKYKGRTDTITSKRLKLMKQDIKDIVGESKQVLSTKIDDLAVNFGNLESKWLGDIIHDAVPDEVPISFIQPAPTQILAAVKATPFNNTTLQDMITTWSTSKIKLFTNATQQAFIQGQGIDDVVRILFGTRALQYTDGLVDGTRRQIRTQVRTAMNHFSSTARDLTYKQNSDLIKGVQWVATLDGRTTLQCINLDGKVDYEDGSRRELNGLRPPAHYNCRSTTVPVIKSLKELGLSDKEFSSSTRASMNGQVPETKRYKDWFKDQPATFQQQVLGKKRYDLYKKGEFTFDKFVENGQELTIQQLDMLNKKPAFVRDYNSDIALMISDKRYDAMRDIVDKCEDQNLVDIWNKHEKDIKIGNSTLKRGGYYVPSNRQIYFNVIEDAKGSRSSAPYQTFFHESGHAIDYRIGFEQFDERKAYSALYKDGIFGQTITDEVEDIIKSYVDEAKDRIKNKDYEWLYKQRVIDADTFLDYYNNGVIPKNVKYTKSFAYQRLENEIKDLDLLTRRNISDIVEGATKGKVKGGFGHGVTYWQKDKDNLAIEAFAEIIDSIMTNEECLKPIKKYLPKTFKIFNEMISEVL
jgi:SPP1 gp7 family putative phage head morphogenesis protein